MRRSIRPKQPGTIRPGSEHHVEIASGASLLIRTQEANLRAVTEDDRRAINSVETLTASI